MNSRDKKLFPAFADYDRGAPLAGKSRIKSSERIASTPHRKMKRCACLAISFFIPSLAQAQVHAGTIIVYQLTNGKFILAADSRDTINRSKGLPVPPNDKYCKITTFGRRFVFAPTGVSIYDSHGLGIVKTWDVNEILKAVIAEHPISDNIDARKQLNAIADAWVDSMKKEFWNMYLFYPYWVPGIAKEQGGELTTGIFALATNNQVVFTTRHIRFDDGIIWTMSGQVGTCEAHPCAAGATDIATEYIFGTSERARAETYVSPAILSFTDRAAFKIIRIAEIAVALDTSETLGGDVDALELSPTGGKRWLQRKDNCPETN